MLKKGILVKKCHLASLKVLYITKQVITINQIYLLTQTSNFYLNILEDHDLLAPYYQGITSQE